MNCVEGSDNIGEASIRILFEVLDHVDYPIQSHYEQTAHVLGFSPKQEEFTHFFKPINFEDNKPNTLNFHSSV